MNLDPAAEKFEYDPTIDIRDLITLEDVMEELQYGPNGGLIYCLEFLLNDMDWLEEELGEYEDDYLIIDCPAMINLEIPHINLLSKMDIIGKVKKKELDRYFDPDPLLLAEEANSSMNPKFHDLNRAIVQLIDDYNMVSFLPLNITDEDSITAVMSHIDNALQFEEDQEPKEPKQAVGMID
ncbi:11589_t:CDS:2 [Acaulospora colombiana]|uniref:11589_t:CDS:1 n=1 Tax=Acaulospora colombiana TaxID=27376 RepID=A0ACA9K2R5_9GLOM|nr:11589_t:CDS:2 [Acaulospora colombiana]